MVGYCSPGSLGAELKSGAKEVRIFGESHQVNAQIEIMDSFSGHADYSEIIQYLVCQDASKVKSLFLVHGEIENQTAFKTRLENVGFQHILIPTQGEGFDL
jgi:metallo-beta-lactamase family protein